MKRGASLSEMPDGATGSREDPKVYPISRAICPDSTKPQMKSSISISSSVQSEAAAIKDPSSHSICGPDSNRSSNQLAVSLEKSLAKSSIVPPVSRSYPIHTADTGVKAGSVPSVNDLQGVSKTCSASGSCGLGGCDGAEEGRGTRPGTVGILSVRLPNGTDRNKFGDGDRSPGGPLFAGTLDSAR